MAAPKPAINRAPSTVLWFHANALAPRASDITYPGLLTAVSKTLFFVQSLAHLDSISVCWQIGIRFFELSIRTSREKWPGLEFLFRRHVLIWGY